MNILKYPLTFKTSYLGLTPYAAALECMESAIAEQKHGEAKIWGLEHPLVYTTGLKVEPQHILDKNLQLVSARRGGSVTLHNPGQLVVYFVLPLDAVRGGLERFVRVLESALAELLLDAGVDARLMPGASGVFTPRGKIAFIGLGLKKNFIYHGISLNIANDLADFRAIYSCGLRLPIARIADFKPAEESKTLFEKFIAVLQERFEDRNPDVFRRAIETKRDLLDATLGFKLGLLAFHERRYWEAHEIWELYWHEMPPGSLRIYFHAMIQIAMAFYKIFTEPNLVGALSLLAKGLEKLHAVPEIERIEKQSDFVLFLEQCHAHIRRAQANSTIDSLGFQAALVPPVVAWL